MRYVLPALPPAGGGLDVWVTDGVGVHRFGVRLAAAGPAGSVALVDPNGRELVAIRRHMFTLRRTFEIHRDGDLFATASRELFAFFRPRLRVDLQSTVATDDYTVDGDFEQGDYVVHGRDGVVLARAVREDASRSVAIDIEGGEDVVMIVVIAVVVELASVAAES